MQNIAKFVIVWSMVSLVNSVRCSDDFDQEKSDSEVVANNRKRRHSQEKSCNGVFESETFSIIRKDFVQKIKDSHENLINYKEMRGSAKLRFQVYRDGTIQAFWNSGQYNGNRDEFYIQHFYSQDEINHVVMKFYSDQSML